MGAEIFGKTRRHIRFLKRKRVELFGFLAHNGVNIFCPANHGVNLFGQGVSTYSVRGGVNIFGRGVSTYSVGRFLVPIPTLGHLISARNTRRCAFRAESLKKRQFVPKDFR